MNKKIKIFLVIIVLLLIILMTIIIYNVTPIKSILADDISTIETKKCLDANTSCKKEDLADGIKVLFKVNDTDEYNFYIINNDESYVTLLLDKNMGESKYSKNNNQEGPTKLIENMSKKTGLWTKVDYWNYYSYQDYNRLSLTASKNKYDPTKNDYTYSENPGGYLEFRIEEGIAKIINSEEITLKDKVRVRGITYEEVTNLMNNKKLPNYLISNLNNGEGFWTISTAPGKKNNTDAYCIINDKGTPKLTSKKVTEELGIRPVIEISKELLN